MEGRSVPGRGRISLAFFIGFAASLAMLSTTSVSAQSDESAPPDGARAAFLRATELYESRSYARAELEFRRAWEMMEGHRVGRSCSSTSRHRSADGSGS